MSPIQGRLKGCGIPDPVRVTSVDGVALSQASTMDCATANALETWVKIAAKRLAPKGQAHFIHRAERLPDLIRALPHDMGSIEVLPIAPRIGRMAELVILRARKSGRGAFRLNAPLIMHEGAQHLSDGDSYVPEIRAVLREGAALPF